VHLQLHHLREIRHVLRPPQIPKLIRRKNERPSDADRRNALNNDGNFRKCHGGKYWMHPHPRGYTPATNFTALFNLFSPSRSLRSLR
jgi:hypothetical protein